ANAIPGIDALALIWCAQDLSPAVGDRAALMMQPPFIRVPSSAIGLDADREHLAQRPPGNGRVVERDLDLPRCREAPSRVRVEAPAERTLTRERRVQTAPLGAEDQQQ